MSRSVWWLWGVTLILSVTSVLAQEGAETDAQPEENGGGVTFIEAAPLTQKMSDYGMSFTPVEIQDQSDATLDAFIIEKMKWENND